MTESTCENCRYFERTTHLGAFSGECRRYPPSLLTQANSFNDRGEIAVVYQPAVFEDDWCGEFERKRS